jgi:hypothetical protein
MKTQRQQVRLDMSTVNGDKEVCVLEYAAGSPVEMSVSCALFGTISVTADDLFEALILIRLEAEKHGYFILCNGARTDAYPSRMSRQMGGGGKLYVFKIGMPAQREDLVNIFEPAEFQHVGTVAAQRVAYDAWLRSLG